MEIRDVMLPSRAQEVFLCPVIISGKKGGMCFCPPLEPAVRFRPDARCPMPVACCLPVVCFLLSEVGIRLGIYLARVCTACASGTCIEKPAAVRAARNRLGRQCKTAAMQGIAAVSLVVWGAILPNRLKIRCPRPESGCSGSSFPDRQYACRGLWWS